MANTPNKTQPTTADVAAFIAAIDDPHKRADSELLLELMAGITGEPACLWGPSIIGFGAYHYKYASGREGDAPRLGFSPRKASLTLYLAPGFAEYDALLARLGKHSTSKACLYVKKLSDIDMGVLEQLVRGSVDWMAEHHP